MIKLKYRHLYLNEVVKNQISFFFYDTNHANYTRI